MQRPPFPGTHNPASKNRLLGSAILCDQCRGADPFVCGRACRSIGGRAILLPSAAHRAAVCPLPPLISTGWRCDRRARRGTRRSIQVVPAPTLSPVTQARLYKSERAKKKKKQKKKNKKNEIDDGQNKRGNNELLRDAR